MYYRAEEKVKLAYLSVKTEVSMQATNNSSYNASDTENTTLLGTMVKNELNDDEWNVDYDTSGIIKITYENMSLRKDGISKGKPSKDGFATFEIIIEEKNVYLALESAVDYGEKTAATIRLGDTIKIGNEQFMVAKTGKGRIIAVPYYNITLSKTNPIQSETAGTVGGFAKSQYWEEPGKNIDMSNEDNNVQPYILAYSEKLSKETEGKVTAQIGVCYDTDNDKEYNINSLSGIKNDSEISILNPSGTKNYWLGSPAVNSTRIVCLVGSSGYIDKKVFSYTYHYSGVRPIIKILLY